MQGSATIRRDADPVALQAVGTSAVPLENGDRNAGAFEPVGQRETARTSANDENTW